MWDNENRNKNRGKRSILLKYGTRQEGTETPMKQISELGKTITSSLNICPAKRQNLE
jgi:hypothetical protein